MVGARWKGAPKEEKLLRYLRFLEVFDYNSVLNGFTTKQLIQFVAQRKFPTFTFHIFVLNFWEWAIFTNFFLYQISNEIFSPYLTSPSTLLQIVCESPTLHEFKSRKMHFYIFRDSRFSPRRHCTLRLLVVPLMIYTLRYLPAATWLDCRIMKCKLVSFDFPATLNVPPTI